jgi:hypothetical protein
LEYQHDESLLLNYKFLASNLTSIPVIQCVNMTVNPFFQKNSILASIQKTLYWKQTPLSIFLCVQDKKIETSHFSFFPLEYPQQKRKSPVKSLPPLVVLCTLDRAFCLLYLLARGKRLLVLIIKMVIP